MPKEEEMQDDVKDAAEGSQDVSDVSDSTKTDEVSQETETDSAETIDYDTEGQKRGYKALFKEIDHKKKDYLKIKEESETLKKKLAEYEAGSSAPKATIVPKLNIDDMPDKDLIEMAMKQPKYKRFIDNKRANGFGDELIADELRVGAFAVQEAISPLNETLHTKKLNDTLDTLAKNDKYKFAVTKFKDKVQEKLRALKVPGEYWNNEVPIMTALGYLMLENPEMLQGNSVKRISKDIAMENKGSSVSGDTGGVSSSELREYAETYGVNLSDAVARRAAIEGLKAKKNALSKLN